MTEPLDTDVIEDATTGLLDHNENPMIDDKDHQVQFINNVANVLLDRVGQGEDMDDEASNFVVWLGGLDRDVMLYGLQLILRPKPLNVVFEDKAQARIDSMQDRLEAATGYVANNFDGIDHHAWPLVHLDGTSQDERVEQILQDEFEAEPVTADMILNGISHDVDLSISERYALGVAIVSEIDDLYNRAKGKGVKDQDYRVFHEKLDSLFAWLSQGPVEIGSLVARIILAVHRVTFDANLMKNWNKFSDQHRDLTLLSH